MWAEFQWVTEAARPGSEGPGRIIVVGRWVSQTGSAKPVQLAQPVGVTLRQQVVAPPLQPEASRGKSRDGEQTDTEDANGASRANGHAEIYTALQEQLFRFRALP